MQVTARHLPRCISHSHMTHVSQSPCNFHTASPDLPRIYPVNKKPRVGDYDCMPVALFKQMRFSAILSFSVKPKSMRCINIMPHMCFLISATHPENLKKINVCTSPGPAHLPRIFGVGSDILHLFSWVETMRAKHPQSHDPLQSAFVPCLRSTICWVEIDAGSDTS